MSSQPPIGLQEARALTLAHIRPLPAEKIDLAEAVDRTAFQDLLALVDSPSVDASLKDGYAVDSRAVDTACSARPVRLALVGEAAAGAPPGVVVTAQTTVRVLTGAVIPSGADAVVSEEFTFREARDIVFHHLAESGRNVMRKGSDVSAGDLVVRAGQVLTPGRLGLLAAAGYRRASVFRKPTVGIVATGDEVVPPGQPLSDGKLYASNMVTLAAWCRLYGMQPHTAIVRDDAESLVHTLQDLASRSDAVITSGGAWTGDRDLVAKVLQQLHWRRYFTACAWGREKRWVSVC